MRAPDGDEVDDFRTFVQGGPSRSHIGAGYCRTVDVRDGSFVGLGRYTLDVEHRSARGRAEGGAKRLEIVA